MSTSGLSSNEALVERLDRVVGRAIADSRIVGSVTFVSRGGELVYARAAGMFDREAGTPMRQDAIFRLTSVSKALTAATALAMVERGLLDLNGAVADHLSYFQPGFRMGESHASPSSICSRIHLGSSMSIRLIP